MAAIIMKAFFLKLGTDSLFKYLTQKIKTVQLGSENTNPNTIENRKKLLIPNASKLCLGL